MTKFSIIIPIFNCKDYLKKGLDSIFAQNFKDFEVICVDDGSWDNSIDILNQYKEIKIVQKSNEGSGIARNIALNLAKGEYILFLDADDWFNDNALIKINDALDKTPDILIFGALSFDKNKLRKGSYSENKIPKKYFNKIFNKNTFNFDIFKFPSTAWTKAYRREFLIKNNIKFQEIFVGQDQIFFLKSMLLADKISILNKNLYCYFKKRAGSITSVKQKNNFSPIWVFQEVEKFLNKLKIDNKYKMQILNHYFLKATFWLSKMQSDLKKEYFNEYKKLLNQVKNNYPDFWWKNFEPKLEDSYFKLKIKTALYITLHLLY